MALAKPVKGGFCFRHARALHQASFSVSGRGLDSSPEHFLLEHADYLTPSMVVNFIQKQGNTDLAYRFFSLASQHAGYKHDGTTYSAILHSLCTSKQFDLIPAVLDDMKAQNCSVGAPTLIHVLNCMGSAGMVQETLTLFKKMKSLGCKLTYCTYNCVLSTLLKAGEIREPMRLFAEMRGAGLHIDSMLVGMLTNALCKAEKVSEAVKLVENIVVKNQGSVDVVTINGVVGYLCRAGRPSDALKLVESMIASGVAPDVITYNKLMAGFCISDQVDEAMRLLDKMSEESLSPSSTTLNTLLKGLCKQSRIDDALQLFKKMGPLVEEDSTAYNILVHALCNKMRIKEAWGLTSEMVRKGVTFTVHTYTAIVCGFLKLGKVEEACKVLQEMKKMGTDADSRLYNEFILGLCREGKVDNAVGLLSQMAESGCSPSQYNYCAVMSGLCKANRVVEALELGYKMMKSGSWDVVAFNPILEVLCESGDKEKAFKLLDVLLDKGVVPTRSTYTAMFKGLCVGKRLDDVRKLLAEMKRNGFDPDFVTYATLINANAHHVPGTVDLFTPLVGSNIVLSIQKYVSLLGGLFVTGEVEFALKVFKDMQRVGCKLCSPVFNVIIDGLCKNDMVNNAQEYLVKMRDYGCAPDHVSYTALMHGYSSKGEYDVLEMLYKEMQADGCKPDVVTYSVLLEGYARGERFQQLYGILADMKAQGCPPNETALKRLFQHLRYKDTKRMSKHIKEQFGLAYDVETLELSQPMRSEEEKEGDMRRSGRWGATKSEEERETEYFLDHQKPGIYTRKGSFDGLEGQTLESKKSAGAKSTTKRSVVREKRSKEEMANPLSSNRVSFMVEGKTPIFRERFKLENTKGFSPSDKRGSSKVLKERTFQQGSQEAIGRRSQRDTKVPQSSDRLKVDGRSYQGKFVAKVVSLKSLQASESSGKQEPKQRKLRKE